MTFPVNLPRVGAGAAIVRDGALLLVLRKRPPEAGHWGLPGGKVDPFETVASAVAREIREELGITIEPVTLLCVIDHIDRERGDHWVAPVYLVERFGGAPAVQEPEALADMGWFPLDALPRPLTQAAEQAVRALQVGSAPPAGPFGRA
ncbi:NUDIX domain-containing protein [Sphingosinicella sp. BN140058]|uniref:NUDIX hydrolase n=1 Tax=Sphingosinicella sp. BN140058 TaxID=1892855 RepID=UPI0010135026|nr:NUDIX domain-containing protein [Sphingosinicella sp. BN140058]QAY75388.1 NUDIX domain-containing protein [Sphingosinicella sp. BN140058]